MSEPKVTFKEDECGYPIFEIIGKQHVKILELEEKLKAEREVHGKAQQRCVQLQDWYDDALKERDAALNGRDECERQLQEKVAEIGRLLDEPTWLRAEVAKLAHEIAVLSWQRPPCPHCGAISAYDRSDISPGRWECERCFKFYSDKRPI